ncbi:hypothetical protein BC830DRAFT_1149037 [Chytriomyces sp. MP71]|nr:hypothetical protein BC830DRAFT_1149037 [Chytriomyces sp. MP71]
MFTLPIGVYFATIDSLFRGQSHYSAICAVVTANLVLIAYIVVAFMEDSADASPSSAKTTTPSVAPSAAAPSTSVTDHYAKFSQKSKISETDLDLDADGA